MQPYSEHMKLDNIKSIFMNIAAHADWKIAIGAGAWMFDWIFGVRQQAVLVVGLLLILDTATGFAYAFKQNNVSSKGFFRFAVKLCVYFTLIVTGRLVDKVLPYQFAAPVMESFLAITEAISIMENLSRCGFAVPVSLIKRLANARGDRQIDPARSENNSGKP